MIKYKLGAVIPTVQYGNYSPEIEVECEIEDLGKAKTALFDHINELWKQYGERAPTDNFSGGETLKTFTGEEIIYNDFTHKYTDLSGNILLSGSAYANSKKPEFKKDQALKGASDSWGVEQSDIETIWGLSSKISTEYGNSIHHALELYHKFKGVGEKISTKQETDVNYVLAKIPHIQDVVLSFEKTFGVNALTEVLVSDVKNKKAGQIDRLEILDMEKKACRIGDFKTNYELDKKKIENYQHQLSFYASILSAHGWTVEGLDLYHFNGEWTKHTLEVLPIS